jgi:hypothetical protein
MKPQKILAMGAGGAVVLLAGGDVESSLEKAFVIALVALVEGFTTTEKSFSAG